VPAPERMSRSGSAETRRDSNGLVIGARFGMVIACGVSLIPADTSRSTRSSASMQPTMTSRQRGFRAANALPVGRSSGAVEVTELNRRRGAWACCASWQSKQVAWAESIRIKRVSALGRRDSEAVTLVSRITDATERVNETETSGSAV
jgi:hypothetical protein